MDSFLLFQLLDVDHDRWVVVQTFEFGYGMGTDLTEFINQTFLSVVLGRDYCYQWVLLTSRGPESLAPTINDIDV